MSEEEARGGLIGTILFVGLVWLVAYLLRPDPSTVRHQVHTNDYYEAQEQRDQEYDPGGY